MHMNALHAFTIIYMRLIAPPFLGLAPPSSLIYAWPAVVWTFITAIFLPSGRSTSTMSAPRWIALHSNQACLAKEKYSLLPFAATCLRQDVAQTCTNLPESLAHQHPNISTLKCRPRLHSLSTDDQCSRLSFGWDISRTRQDRQQQRSPANLASS